MEEFKGYVLQSELSEKAKVSNSNFSQMDVIKKKMGSLSCLLKSSLPEKYKKIAEEKCIDLGTYCSYSYLSSELGMNIDYIADIERNRDKDFEFKRIGKVKLFKLTDDFLDYIHKGLTPFKIRRLSEKEDRALAREIIYMQNIQIGFY